MICPIQETCSFDTEAGVYSVSLHDILWVDGGDENSVGMTRLHLADRVIDCRMDLAQVLPMLGEQFLLCLNHGAVNELRIRRFEAEALVLDTGERLELSPFLAPRFMEKYCRDLTRRVWED